VKHSGIHRLFSVALALLVMLSTISFTIEKHFCGGTLVDVALFTDAESCGKEMPSDFKKPCCKDEVEVVEGQNELKVSLNDLNLQEQQFVATFYNYHIELFEGLPEQVIPFKEYSPPKLVYDRLVLHEVFII